MALRPKITVCKDDVAYKSSFRFDEALLTAGDKKGVVRVSVSTSRPRGRSGPSAHTAETRVVRYPVAAGDKVHLLTAEEDALLAYWDVPSETPVFNVPAQPESNTRCIVVSYG